MPKDNMKMNMPAYHMHKGKGVMMIVLGLLVLANAYWSILSWAMFVGIIFVLAGIAKMLKM